MIHHTLTHISIHQKEFLSVSSIKLYENNFNSDDSIKNVSVIKLTDGQYVLNSAGEDESKTGDYTVGDTTLSYIRGDGVTTREWITSEGPLGEALHLAVMFKFN